MAVTVPTEHREAFDRLIHADASFVSALTDAFSLAKPSLYQPDFARSVAEVMPGMTHEEIRPFVAALWPIGMALAGEDRPRAPFLRRIADALVADRIGTRDQVDAFIPVLDVLLIAEGLALSTKARSLLTDGNNYCHSRALTDIRPIFGSGQVAAPKAAVPVHHLTISYHEGDAPQTRDFVVSLDSDDIDDLINVLQRAKQKQEQLRPVLAETKLKYLQNG